VRQQLVERYGARRAFEGGLRVDTTLDLELQAAAERAIDAHLADPSGPAAALVAIDNDTGEVRAMVGGRDYNKRPFNLATQGQRQPGSAFKPFTLATALTQGIGPGSVWPSRKREFDVPGGEDKFVVNNFEGNYTGTQTLAGGLTTSDNAVYAAVGLHVGTKRVARTARRMGIRTPVSSNPAMTLGGLRQGVTPLDMAHAYETFAAGGRRVTGTLGAPERGPVGIRSVRMLGNGRLVDDNVPRHTLVLDPAVASTATQIMASVVQQGTGRRAAFGEFAAGKTGTTENSGDAWFVGFTKRLTVAVWVGYADKLKPMLTEFGGKPVEGGTFPAVIWHDFMLTADGILDRRAAAEALKKGLPPVAEATTTTPSPAVSQPVAPGVELLQRGDHALLTHALQDQVAPRVGRVGVRDGVVRARRGDDPGQQRRLVGLEVLGAAGARAAVAAGVRAAEVGPGGRLDPVRAVAEVDRVQVLREDLRLRPLAREMEGQRRLAQLLEQGPLGLGAHRVLDELLGDGRAALGRLPLDHVLDERAPDAAQVDARVLVEAAVLDRDHRVADVRRDLAPGHEHASVAVGQDAELLARTVVEDRVARVLVLLAVLEVWQVGRDRHHHPESRRDPREQQQRSEHDDEPQALDLRRRLRGDVVAVVAHFGVPPRGPAGAVEDSPDGQPSLPSDRWAPPQWTPRS